MKSFEVTDDNICEVTTKQAYEWVKTGKWSFKEFQFWWHETTKLQVSCVVESILLKAHQGETNEHTD